MSATRDDVLKLAMHLSEADRLLLATELLETVSEDLPGLFIDDPDLLSNLDRRATDGAPGVRWDVVRERLRADLD